MDRVRSEGFVFDPRSCRLNEVCGESETRGRTADMMLRDNYWLYSSQRNFKHTFMHKNYFKIHMIANMWRFKVEVEFNIKVKPKSVVFNITITQWSWINFAELKMFFRRKCVFFNWVMFSLFVFINIEKLFSKMSCFARLFQKKLKRL